MSQVSIIDIEGNHPEIPTRFDANVGFAIPIANVLEILGESVAAGTTPVQTVGSGNTITTQVQISQAIAASNATNVGLAAFDSAFFTVDANGFVSLTGGAVTESFNVDASTPPGTDPVVPNGSGVVTVTGGQVAAGTTTNVIRTNSLAANTYTIEIQRSSAQAISTIGANGVSHFDSSAFDVDANGFVQLNGGGIAATSFNVDANSPPGTDPVVPNAAGQVSVTGGQVASGTIGANVIRTNSLAVNSYTIQVQQSGSAAAQDTTLNGVAHFNSAHFTVSNGFVSLAGGGEAIDSIAVQTGTSPIVPTVLGLVTINGGTVVAGTNPVRSNGTGANTLEIQVQISQALAATDATKIGLANFNSAHFSVDANGFVSLLGGGEAIDSIGVDASTAPGTNPVLPDANGLLTVTGAQVAAGTVGANVIRSNSIAANAYRIEIQRSTSNATTDSTKNGVAHFNSAHFSVDSNAFVSATGAIAIQYTADSGTAVPAAGNLNILGGPGVTTSASGSTVTINSVVFTDQSGVFTASSDNGYFLTAASTPTLPASPAQGEIVVFVCDTASTVTVTANTGQKIRLGNTISATAGTAASTAQGDVLVLRYRSSGATWFAVSEEGNWNVT